MLKLADLGGNGGFGREMGTIWGGGDCHDAVLVPTKCLPVNAAQTHETQRQEKVSPSAKNPCVYATSVAIEDSCVPGA